MHKLLDESCQMYNLKFLDTRSFVKFYLPPLPTTTKTHSFHISPFSEVKAQALKMPFCSLTNLLLQKVRAQHFKCDCPNICTNQPP